MQDELGPPPEEQTETVQTPEQAPEQTPDNYCGTDVENGDAQEQAAPQGVRRSGRKRQQADFQYKPPHPRHRDTAHARHNTQQAAHDVSNVERLARHAMDKVDGMLKAALQKMK